MFTCIIHSFSIPVLQDIKLIWHLYSAYQDADCQAPYNKNHGPFSKFIVHHSVCTPLVVFTKYYRYVHYTRSCLITYICFITFGGICHCPVTSFVFYCSRCPSYNNLPSGCHVMKKAQECCPVVQCQTGYFYSSSTNPGSLANGLTINVLQPPAGEIKLK